MICSLCESGKHHAHSMKPCDCTNGEHAVVELAAQVKSIEDRKAARKRARATDPKTSHKAATSITKQANVQQKRIWNELVILPGTFHELAARTGLPPAAVHKRLPELQQLQMAEPTEIERPGPSGRMCRVWRFVAKYHL